MIRKVSRDRAEFNEKVAPTLARCYTMSIQFPVRVPGATRRGLILGAILAA